MKIKNLKYCLIVIALLTVNHAKASAKAACRSMGKEFVIFDTLETKVYKETEDIKNQVFHKLTAAFEREKLLDKLSKIPSDFPEFFLNAKEEYLWREKEKAQMDANERPVTFPDDAQRIRLHVKNAGRDRGTP